MASLILFPFEALFCLTGIGALCFLCWFFYQLGTDNLPDWQEIADDGGEDEGP
jgi:hypothetical protein